MMFGKIVLSVFMRPEMNNVSNHQQYLPQKKTLILLWL